MQEQIDIQIISLYKKGMQQDALKLLLYTYQERLYWHIRRMLISHDDTDDVLQNTVVKIWKGLDKFKAESKLYTWMFRIASNETYTFLEKNKKYNNHIDIESNFEFKSTINSDDPTGEEIQKKLEQAIATLPEKQRMVFHLKYYEEMKYSEMSETLGTSVGALKANYHLAVKKIEHFLTSN